MLGIGKRFRVVQRDGSGVRAWSPQTRAQALVEFGRRVADGHFTPWGGPQLMVLSEEEWDQLSRSGYVDVGGGDDRAEPPQGRGSDVVRRPGSKGRRRMFGLLPSSRSRS